MPDVYDDAIASLLSKTPTDIQEAWQRPFSVPEGVLFGYSSPDYRMNWVATAPGKGYSCGCVLELHRGGTGMEAVKANLADQIRADTKLPDSLDTDTLRDMSGSEIEALLKRIARWQRQIDRALNRTPPATLKEATKLCVKSIMELTPIAA